MRTQKEVDDEYESIDQMLTEIESHFADKGASNAFIESIREQFTDRRTLSEKQTEAVKKFYERIC